MTDRQLIRGISSFTSAAAKWGSAGRASGVYNISNSTGFWTDNANIPDSTIECWFKTSSATSISGSSTQMLLARFKYYWLGLDTQGVNLYYGLDSAIHDNPAHGALIFPGALCDGQWHHVAAVFSGGGGTAYCDGVRLGSDIATPVGTGTDIEVMGGYGNTSEAYEWSGAIDEVRYSNIARYTGASYTVPTGPFTVDVNTVALYHLEGSTLDATQSVAAPIAAFTAAVSGPTVTFDGSGSTSADVPVDGYLWDFGDGHLGAGVTPSHMYAAAGTYTVTLTVTNTADLAGTVSHTVTPSVLTAPAWSNVVGWLNTTLPSLFGVTGFDGPPNTGDQPVDYVSVGWTASGETGGEFASVESEDGLGLAEQGHVLFDLVCQTGDDSLAEVRARAFTNVELLRGVMRTDPTLGGILSVNATVSLSNVIVQNISNQAGVAVALVVTFEYTTLAWPD